MENDLGIWYVKGQIIDKLDDCWRSPLLTNEKEGRTPSGWGRRFGAGRWSWCPSLVDLRRWELLLTGLVKPQNQVVIFIRIHRRSGARQQLVVPAFNSGRILAAAGASLLERTLVKRMPEVAAGGRSRRRRRREEPLSPPERGDLVATGSCWNAGWEGVTGVAQVAGMGSRPSLLFASSPACYGSRWSSFLFSFFFGFDYSTLTIPLYFSLFFFFVFHFSNS